MKAPERVHIELGLCLNESDGCWEVYAQCGDERRPWSPDEARRAADRLRAAGGDPDAVIGVRQLAEDVEALNRPLN